MRRFLEKVSKSSSSNPKPTRPVASARGGEPTKYPSQSSISSRQKYQNGYSNGSGGQNGSGGGGYKNQNNGKEVARVAEMLREIYSLDLEIWSMESSHEDGVPAEMEK